MLSRRSLLMGATMLLGGCSASTPQPKLIPVQGKITVQGKPLEYGRVVYKPVAPNATDEPRGTIAATGGYAMQTGERMGVAPGMYQVQIFAISPASEQDSTKPPVWGANQKYAGPASGLQVEVSESTPPEKYNFDLEL